MVSGFSISPRVCSALSIRMKRAFRDAALPRLLAMLAIAAATAPAEPMINPPEMIPNGATGWVGTTQFGFKKVSVGRIFYTTDGSAPTNKSTEYAEGEAVTINRTLTVKAVHYTALSYSSVISADFIRAKLPAPIARYGGNTNFYPAVTCTLSVPRDGAAPLIHYTLDGSAPTPSSTIYSGPLTFRATTTLRAYAVQAGLDDSDPIQVSFTMPPPPSPPQATPPGQPFSTNTQTIKLKSASTGIFYRYTLDTSLKVWDNAPIVAGDSISIVGKTVGEVITVRIQTCKTGYPPSAIVTEKYTYLPAVATPTASRPAGYFYDTATVILSSGTSGADIRYVLDSQPLGPNSPDGSKPIFLESSAYLKATAFKSPQPASGILTVQYNLRLTAPILGRQSQQFKDVLYVRISAKAPNAGIYYTLDGTDPTVTTGTLIRNGDSVAIGAPITELRAFAVKDGIASAIVSATYTRTNEIKKLSAPIIEPAGRDFVDSQSVELRSAEGAGAQIHYTVDGSVPTRASPVYLDGHPLRFDSTTMLRAQAFPVSGSLESSDISEARYTLTPSQPYATPTPTEPYANSVAVTLETRTRNGSIRYLLGDAPLALEFGTLYEKGKPIVINSTTRLRAVTVIGTGTDVKFSAALDVVYEIYTSNPSDTLAAGASRSLTGGFVFVNNSGFPIIAKTHSLAGFPVTGFRDPSLGILLQAIPTDNSVKVIYTRQANQAGSLYRIVNGSVEYLSSDSRVDLNQGGEYFIGVDTLPPILTLLSQTPKSGDSTVVRLSVTDNIINPTCRITSPGLPGGEAARKPGADGSVTAMIKSPGPDVDPKALWFRAAAGDFYNTGRLPKDATGRIYVSQIWGKVKTPDVLPMGQAVSPWTMAGFPVSASAPVIWGQVKQDNPDAGLKAAVWSIAEGANVFLDDSSAITPGMAIWLGSPSARNSISLSRFRAGESGSDGSYRMLLHTGWNQVTSPSLDKVYWPTTKTTTKNGQVLLKAPYQYFPASDGYIQVDSLDPWIGYFVYYYGTRDTVIQVYTDPSRRGSAKSGAGEGAENPTTMSATVSEGVGISLDFGKSTPLFLGAMAWAQDGVGSEDEPELPAWGRSMAAWSQREGRHLVSDQVRFHSGGISQWKVVLEDAAKETGGTAGPGKIKVVEGVLPLGYQAWAVSGSRGMKFRLEPGMEVPLSGLARDTLTVYAGPLAKLDAIPELSTAVASVERFAYDLEKGPNGTVLRVALPWNSGLEAEIWSASGRLLAASSPGRLTPGIYRFPLSRGTGSQAGFLKIRLRGESGQREFSRKVRF
ncbi:MAG: hypothetical protein JWP91_4577 [Fibrobacteres bacterium]|nr:hypothetical protein [Fibrobacterota bacterium]